MPETHTVVVGGGVVGVAAAYYLAKRGVRVTLLEQDDELCTGSSRGNAGQVTPGHLPLSQPGTLNGNLRWLLSSRNPLYVAPRIDFALLRWLWRFRKACNERHLRTVTEMLGRLGAASAVLFDQLAPVLGIAYEAPGRLEVCRGERSFQAVRMEAAMLEEFGFDHQVLRGEELSQFEPAVHGHMAGAVYFPNSGYCNPHAFTMGLSEAARRLGATIRTGTNVTDLRVKDGRLSHVVAADEEIAADAVMLGFTQGPITGKLLAEGILGDQPSIDLFAVRPDRF